MSLELKIPPPAVAAVSAAIMWVISRLTPHLGFPASFRVTVALTIGAAAFAIAAAGVLSFRRARTTINPTQPGKSTSLVVANIYRFTRNPMYLGLVLVLLAWAVFLSSAWALIGAAGFLIYMNRFQIAPEERALKKLFGQEFEAYKSKVRRWV